MTVIDLDAILCPENINYFTYQQLIALLNENQSWKIIAECFGIFSEWEIRNLATHIKPAEKFIYELGTRLCSIKVFCEILERCQLYSILLLFKEHSPLRILQQTTVTGCSKGQFVKSGEDVKLHVEATGMPPPSYQWFQENLELEGKIDSTLILHNFGLENEGDYYCIVSQEGFGSMQSNVVTVVLAPKCPTITKQPTSKVICSVGSKVTLLVEADGHPKLDYHWYKENQQLNEHTSSTLILNINNKSQCGKYRCYIHNSAGEVWSDDAIITLQEHPSTEPTAKLALLISNQLYENMSHLYKAENDVKTLSDCLKNLGFYVVALQNLNLIEMKNSIKVFSGLLPPNAYVVFYFAGHGFEIHDKFMLPVDTPDPDDYLQSDAICERQLLKIILSSKPKVFLELLDMCLKPPNATNQKIFQETPELYEYQANNNLIQGYSTTSYLGAYEKKTGENGLYVEHLKKYLVGKNDLPIVEILQKVGKDVASVSPNQKPFFGTNVTLEYRLSDKCIWNSSVMEKFEKLSLIPKQLRIPFESAGVESSVTFSAYLNVFLNTLEIRFTKLTDFRITCEALGEELTFNLHRDHDDLFIKVMNLQRLTSYKTLSLILKQNGKEVDRADLDIGKPMIAVADLWQSTSWAHRNLVELGFHMTQMLSGHGPFNYFQHHIGKAESPHCDEKDDMIHALNNCPVETSKRTQPQEFIPELTLEDVYKRITMSK